MKEFQLPNGAIIEVPDTWSWNQTLRALRLSPERIKLFDDDVVRSWGTDAKRGVTPEQHYWRVRENPQASKMSKVWADEWKRRFGEPARGETSTAPKPDAPFTGPYSQDTFQSVWGKRGSQGLDRPETMQIGPVKHVALGAQTATASGKKAANQRGRRDVNTAIAEMPAGTVSEALKKGVAQAGMGMIQGVGLGEFPTPEKVLGLIALPLIPGMTGALGGKIGRMAGKEALGRAIGERLGPEIAGMAMTVPQALQSVEENEPLVALFNLLAGAAPGVAFEAARLPGALNRRSATQGAKTSKQPPAMAGPRPGALQRLSEAEATAKAAAAVGPPRRRYQPPRVLDYEKPRVVDKRPPMPPEPTEPTKARGVIEGSGAVLEGVTPPVAGGRVIDVPSVPEVVKATHTINEQPVARVGGKWREVKFDGSLGATRRPTEAKPAIEIAQPTIVVPTTITGRRVGRPYKRPSATIKGGVTNEGQVPQAIPEAVSQGRAQATVPEAVSQARPEVVASPAPTPVRPRRGRNQPVEQPLPDDVVKITLSTEYAEPSYTFRADEWREAHAAASNDPWRQHDVLRKVSEPRRGLSDADLNEVLDRVRYDAPGGAKVAYEVSLNRNASESTRARAKEIYDTWYERADAVGEAAVVASAKPPAASKPAESAAQRVVGMTGDERSQVETVLRNWKRTPTMDDAPNMGGRHYDYGEIAVGKGSTPTVGLVAHEAAHAFDLVTLKNPRAAMISTPIWEVATETGKVGIREIVVEAPGLTDSGRWRIANGNGGELLAEAYAKMVERPQDVRRFAPDVAKAVEDACRIANMPTPDEARSIMGLQGPKPEVAAKPTAAPAAAEPQTPRTQAGVSQDAIKQISAEATKWFDRAQPSRGGRGIPVGSQGFDELGRHYVLSRLLRRLKNGEPLPDAVAATKADGAALVQEHNAKGDPSSLGWQRHEAVFDAFIDQTVRDATETKRAKSRTSSDEAPRTQAADAAPAETPTVDVERIRQAIGIAVGEQPGRLGHGMKGPKGQRADTRYSAFNIMPDGSVRTLDDSIALDTRQAVGVHSHLSTDYTAPTDMSGAYDTFSTGASGDIGNLVKQARMGRRRAEAVITHYDPKTGTVTFDLLVIPEDVRRLPTTREINAGTEVKYGDTPEGMGSYQFIRQRIREFAAQQGWQYQEGLTAQVAGRKTGTPIRPAAEPPSKAPTAKASEVPVANKAAQSGDRLTPEQFASIQQRLEDIWVEVERLDREAYKLRNKPRKASQATAAKEAYVASTKDEVKALREQLNAAREARRNDAAAFDDDLARVFDADRQARTHHRSSLDASKAGYDLAKDMPHIQQIVRDRASDLNLELDDQSVLFTVRDAMGLAAREIVTRGEQPRPFAEYAKQAVEVRADTRIRDRLSHLQRRNRLGDALDKRIGDALQDKTLGSALDERASLLRDAEVAAVRAQEAAKKAAEADALAREQDRARKAELMSKPTSDVIAQADEFRTEMRATSAKADRERISRNTPDADVLVVVLANRGLSVKDGLMDWSFNPRLTGDDIALPAVKPAPPVEAVATHVDDVSMNRPTITGVYRDANAQMVVATDTTRLIAIPDKVTKSEIVAKDGHVIAGEYPNWQRVFPDPATMDRYQFNLDQARRAGRAVVAFGKSTNRTDGAVVLDGDGQQIALNARYVVEAIEAMQSTGAKTIDLYVSRAKNDRFTRLYDRPLLLVGDNGSKAVLMTFHEAGNRPHSVVPITKGSPKSPADHLAAASDSIAQVGKGKPDALDVAADAAAARLKRNLGRASTGVDPTIVSDAIIVGARMVRNGVRDFAAWSERMVAELGEAVRPYLQRTWDDVQRSFTKKLGASDVPKVSKTPPTRTVKAYKLFRTDPKHPGKLFPLYFDSRVPLEPGVWFDAEFGEKSGFASRPGYHAGASPAATHIGSKSPGSKAVDTRPPEQVWAEVEMAADVDWQSEVTARARRNKATGEIVASSAELKDQLPVGGYYRYKTNPNMTGEWLISGSMKINRVLSDAEVAAINKAAGVADLPRRQPATEVAQHMQAGVVEHSRTAPKSPADHLADAADAFAEAGRKSAGKAHVGVDPAAYRDLVRGTVSLMKAGITGARDLIKRLPSLPKDVALEIIAAAKAVFNRETPHKLVELAKAAPGFVTGRARAQEIERRVAAMQAGKAQAQEGRRAAAASAREVVKQAQVAQRARVDEVRKHAYARVAAEKDPAKREALKQEADASVNLARQEAQQAVREAADVERARASGLVFDPDNAADLDTGVWAGRWDRPLREVAAAVYGDKTPAYYDVVAKFDTESRKARDLHHDALVAARWRYSSEARAAAEKGTLKFIDGTEVNMGTVKAAWERVMKVPYSPPVGYRGNKNTYIWNAYRDAVHAAYSKAATDALGPKAAAKMVMPPKPVPFETAASHGQPLPMTLFDILGGLRSIPSSGDFSYLARQGWMPASRVLFSRKAGAVPEGMARAAYAAMGEQNYEAVMAKARNRYVAELTPHEVTFADLVNDTNLYLAHDGMKHRELGSGAAEEIYPTNWPETLGHGALNGYPVLGAPSRAVSAWVRASDRLYSAGLDLLRLDTFEMAVRNLLKQGYSPKTDFRLFEQAAKLVNVTSRRGNLNVRSFPGTEGMKLANIFMFGPRYRLSGLEMIAKAATSAVTPRNPVSREYYKTLGSGAAIGLMMSALAVMALKRRYPDAKVNTDPTHTDFLRVTAGKRQWDLIGGMNLPIRDVVRTFYNIKTSRSGKSMPIAPYRGVLSAMTVGAGEHGISGFSPFARIVDRMTAQGPLDVATVLRDLATPMAARDVYESAKLAEKEAEPAWLGALLGAPSLAGAGVGITPEPPPRRRNRRSPVRRGR